MTRRPRSWESYASLRNWARCESRHSHLNRISATIAAARLAAAYRVADATNFYRIRQSTTGYWNHTNAIRWNPWAPRSAIRWNLEPFCSNSCRCLRCRGSSCFQVRLHSAMIRCKQAVKPHSGNQGYPK